MWMRGGTSKGGYFLKDDLPAATATRDAFLLAVMGSPDPRQIDGMGGADPLTSKVAVVSKSTREGIDVDYLFLQVFVDQAIVTDAQNCGNILAGVGPFAIERGLVAATGDETSVSIYMENTGQVAVAVVETPGGFTGERVLRAPDDGIFHQLLDIGTTVQAGDIAGEVNGKPMACTIAGVIRGMLADGTPFYKGMKSGDVDPRGEISYCQTASDKAIAIGGGVLQAILEYTGVLNAATGKNALGV